MIKYTAEMSEVDECGSANLGMWQYTSFAHLVYIMLCLSCQLRHLFYRQWKIQDFAEMSRQYFEDFIIQVLFKICLFYILVYF